MGASISEAGGGPATGLADFFVNFLKGGLQTGTFGTGDASHSFAGANPTGSTTGIAGVLNDVLAGGGGNLGGSLGKMIAARQGQDIADLRSRFGAGGGMSFGTPAAYAESTYRARAAPEAAIATGGLQLETLMPLLQMITGLSGKGIPQAQMFAQANPFLQLLSALGGAAQGAGSLIGGINAGGGSATTG